MHYNIPSNIAGFLLFIICYYAFIIYRGRKAMRTLENALASPKESDRHGLCFEQLPINLKKLINHRHSSIQKLGFSEIYIGAKLRLKKGAADNYHQIFLSADKTTFLEFTLIRVPRVFAIFPVPLPFSEYIGPSVLSLSLESMFNDNSTLITTTYKEVAACNVPGLKVLIVNHQQNLEEIWQTHAIERKRIIEKDQLESKTFNNVNDFFEKEKIQRQQIDKKNEKLIASVRQESHADLWDSSPRNQNQL